jgi:hypothetical protein
MKYPVWYPIGLSKVPTCNYPNCNNIVIASNLGSPPDISVESNSCLAVKPKNVKLSYAEMVKVTTAVEMQDRIIGNGRDPTTDLIQVDIKKK